MIVMKFGGTSVESAEAITRVAKIVESRLPQEPVVVVSAMGKTTNKLIAIGEMAAEGNPNAHTHLGALRAFHLAEVKKLGIDESTRAYGSINATFQELKEFVQAILVVREISPRVIDAVSACGERISSMIVAAAFTILGSAAPHDDSLDSHDRLLGSHYDSRRLIKTDARHTQATPLLDESYTRLNKSLLGRAACGIVPVLGGFIASTMDDVTTTLGRGGSDYTAAIVGAAIGAEEIQIWTDVDGMLTCDPTILADGYRVKTCSFAEAAELAYFGAKVLHPATVLPAIQKNIPVRILNSRRPESEGTLIVAEAPPCADPIRSIACKRNITLVNIVSTRMLMAHGFLRRIFEVFDRFETPVDMLATSEVSVSLTIDNTRSLVAIRAELETFAEVSIEEDHAIVCLVGENIRRTPGVAARVFCALKDIHVRMVSQGASLLNISLVISAADVARAVESLHREFFHHPDPSAFERTTSE